MIDFKTGDVVLFSNTNSLFGKAISKMTKSKWTHAGIVYYWDKKYVLVAEAVTRGFVVRKYSRKLLQKRFYEKTLLVREPVFEITGIKPICNYYLTTKYGWGQILNIALKIIFKKEIKADGEKTLICSEAVSRVLYDASSKIINFEKEFNVSFDYVTPKNLSKSGQIKTKK